ncbi:MAG: hypothetical protein ACOWW1_00365 [archaeon]
MDSEIVIKEIINFVCKTGRLPTHNEPGFEEIITKSIKYFGSLENAILLTGLMMENNEEQHNDSFSGKIRKLLNFHPMTLSELRQELDVSSDNASKIITIIKQNYKIQSVGPRKFKVYFIDGQELLALTHLEEIMHQVSRLGEDIFYLLKQPMTKEMLANCLFGKNYRNYNSTKISRNLRELILARLVYKIEFVIGKGRDRKKFSSRDFFGDLADKTYYCRFDCSEEVAGLIIKNVITNEAEILEIEEIMFNDKKTRKMKTLLPDAVYRIVEPYLNR